jgi:hypothetical protein
MFENKQVEGLFNTSLDYLFNTKVDDLFNYKKPAPITYKRREWEKYQYTLKNEGTINIFDIFGDNSAVALYRFEGNANDDGGQYNGTWHGNEQYVDGKFGQAAKFDGNGSYIDIGGNFDEIITSGSSFSISGWIRWDALNNWSRFVDFKGYFVVFNKGTGNTLIVDYRGNNNHRVQLDNFIEIGKLYHFVYVYNKDTNEYLLYINGNKMNTTDDDAGDNVSTKSGNYIAKSNWDGDDYFKGLIDQVRIFNKALTDEEVNTLYNEKVNTIKTVIDYKKTTLNGLNIKTKISTDYLNNPNDIKFRIAPYLNNPNDIKFKIAPYLNNPNDVKFKISKYLNNPNDIKFKIAPYLNNLNDVKFKIAPYLNNLNDVKFKIAPYLNNLNDIKFKIAPYKNLQNYIFYRIGYDSPPPIRIIVKDLDDN